MQVYKYIGDAYHDKNIVVAENGKAYMAVDNDGETIVYELGSLEELHTHNYLNKPILQVYGDWKDPLVQYVLKENDVKD